MLRKSIILQDQIYLRGIELKNWKLSRIESLVRSILRISIYELLYETNVPKKVIFNEYIEIAKFFFDGEESSLINAVLDAVSKNDDK